MITANEEFGLSTMVWSPLGQGLFGGRATRNGEMPDGTRRGTDGWLEPYITDWNRFAATLDAVTAVADETGRSIPQVTLAWLRDRPGVGSLVLGARTEEQLRDNLGSIDLVLTPGQAERIEVAGRPAPIYPFWHRAMWATERPTPSEAGYLQGYRQTIGI